MTINNKNKTNELTNKKDSEIQDISYDKKIKASYLLKTKVRFEKREGKDSFAIKDLDKEAVLRGFLEAFGSYDPDVSHGLVNTLTCVLGNDEMKESDLNFAIAFVKQLEPQDPLEAMLAIQMLGNHLISCKTLYRAGLKEQTFDGLSENINRATKLSRTFISQMDALKKYRNKGNQKITVEHVNINEGGKAIIGSTINNQFNNKSI
jgi:hypothetical protein